MEAAPLEEHAQAQPLVHAVQQMEHAAQTHLIAHLALASSRLEAADSDKHS